MDVCSVVKVRACKHVRKGLAQPVNKSGECQICRNAKIKTKAGIKVLWFAGGAPVFGWFAAGILLHR